VEQVHVVRRLVVPRLADNTQERRDPNTARFAPVSVFRRACAKKFRITASTSIPPAFNRSKTFAQIQNTVPLHLEREQKHLCRSRNHWKKKNTISLNQPAKTVRLRVSVGSVIAPDRRPYLVLGSAKNVR
jgi:hypothetical protein